MIILLVVSAVVNSCVSEYAPFSNGITSYSNDNPCPSAGGSCAGGTTCCPTGCCPLPDAVCCSDEKHCCPLGAFCDLELQMCVGREGQFISELQNNGRQYTDSTLSEAIIGSLMKASLRTKSRVTDVPCPGAGGSCPDHKTCCQSGCCPFPDAVCCNDGLRCCPSGMTCDSERGFCVGSQRKIFTLSPKKTSGISSKVSHAEILRVAPSTNGGIVYCPGGHFYCPDYNTCCILPSGLWGCCPFQSATCCRDKIHCCPAGLRCDVTSLHCISGYGYEFARKKFPAFSLRDD